MKKATLLLIGAALATGSVQAQSLRQRSVVAIGGDIKTVAQAKKTPFVADASTARANRSHFAKGAATPFYTQPFAGGLNGWTPSSLTAGIPSMWRWATSAPSGTGNPYPLAAIMSTTASNGFLLCNADSIGVAFPSAAPVESAITSPTISCAGHTTVQIGFQQYFRRFVDSCFVDVSNNGGTSYTTFPVTINNNLPSNTALPNNPTTTVINISSVAANQANVKLRFRYKFMQAGGAYNWDVDDVFLSELDPVEIDLHNTGVLQSGPSTGFTNLFAYTAIPLQFADTLFPVAFLSNNGANAGTATVVNAKIFNGTTQVYNQSLTYNLPVNGQDSLVDFSATPYVPTARGNYTVVFSINPTGDANAANNQDTTRFSITDTVYASEGPTSAGGYYIHRAAASGTTELSFYQGVRFSIPDGRTDTITSMSVSFNSGTSVGAPVQGQLYKAAAAGTGFNWTSVARTITKTLAAGDISTTSGLVYTSIPMVGIGATISNLKLTSGDYAAVITGVGVTASQSVIINATVSPYSKAPTFVGYTGQSDSSSNNAQYTFADGGGIATGSTTVPRVRVNFSKYSNPGPGAVGTIPGVTVGEAFPNPANTFINVPVTVKEATSATIILTNVTGQVVRTHDMGTIGAGNMNIASINTSDLANGVYIYTINANGGRAAGRIVVRH